MQEKKYIRARHELKHLKAGFQHFINTDSIQTKITNLENSSEYQRAKSKELELLRLEKSVSKMFLNQYQKEVLIGKSMDNFSWWKKEYKKLNQATSTSSNEAEKRIYERVRSLLGGGFYESSASCTATKDYKRALYCDQLLALLNSNNAYVHYRLSISYARNKDFSNTIKNLKKAKELHLKDFQKTKSTPEFSQYQNRRKFLKLYN